MRRNSLLIKVQLLNRIFTKNCATRTEILLVSLLMYAIFYITPVLLLPKFNNNLLHQNEGEETQSQEHQHPWPILLESRRL